MKHSQFVHVCIFVCTYICMYVCIAVTFYLMWAAARAHRHCINVVTSTLANISAKAQQ